jgi:hypothetical protein
MPQELPLSRNFNARRYRIRDGSADAVHRWRREMNDRIEELRATLGPEGINLEIVLIEHAKDGDYLVFILDCADYERAVEVYSRSEAPIDNFHRQFLADNLLEREDLELAYWAEP